MTQDPVVDRSGYSTTAEMPNDWSMVNLGTVATITMGQSPPSSTYNGQGCGLAFLQGKAEFGDIHPTPVKWCSEPQKIASRGSVLISVRAPVGDTNIANEDYCIGRGLAGINGNDFLDNWFLFHLLTYTKQRLKDLGTGSTFKSINKGVLQAFPISLPPLHEQRRIAHVLRTIHEAIAAQEQVIAAARELKRSLMQRLFTYGPGPEPAPTKETEVGPVPEHWEVVRLGEAVQKPQYGYTATATHDPVGPRFLRITDIQNGHVSWSSVPFCVIDDSELPSYRLCSGDVLVARIGATTGKTYMVEDPPRAVFASYLIRLSAKLEVLLPEYLYYFTGTQGYWEQINASKGGRLKKGVNIPVLRSLLLPLAPLDEQREIAHHLGVIDRKLESDERRKAALQALFQSMLQQLMTGQIRV